MRRAFPSQHPSIFLLLACLVACGPEGSGPAADCAPGEGACGSARAALSSPQWGATGSALRTRINATATQLPNGKVLVTGGSSAGALQATSELYDPATGTWSATGSLGTSRSDHATVLLASGAPLGVGGLTGTGRYTGHGSVAAAESFNAGAWSAAGTLSTPRHFHGTVVLQSGAVLTAGGLNKIGGASVAYYQATAELYDAATNTWRPTASMLSTRANFTASLLPSGQVLAVGGGDSVSPALGSAELYSP
jgi:hypothetical protein